MELRYGIIDENVRKRSVLDTILHERQSFEQAAKAPERSGIIDEIEGTLALMRAVNEKAAQGVRAVSFEPHILLPPGTQEETLRDLYRQVCRAGFAIGLEIESGYTEVTDAVTRPVVTGSVKGIPFQNSRDRENISNVQEPCACIDIVAAGRIGLEGSWILVHSCRDQLRERFQESLLIRIQELKQQMCILRAAETAAVTVPASAAGAGQMVSLSGGGFFAGLWELSKKTGCGLTVDLPLVPILQETIEITNYLEINPYLMRSAGCLLIAAPDGEGMVRNLQAADVSAVCIGTLQDSNNKIIRNGEEIRSLDRPQTDALDLYLHRNRYKYE